MDKLILKGDMIFRKDDLSIFMSEIVNERIQETIDAVTSAYPVLDYVVKGNFIYVATKNAHFINEAFDLCTAYSSCIKVFNDSQPYFETEISYENTIVNKDTFTILPMGTDVFDLQPKTNKEFKENVLDHIEEWTGKRDEKLFDKLFKQLYNTNKSGENNG